MPVVTQCESQTVLAKASPTRKNRLSLRFFQKKETKRALDFVETPQTEEQSVEEKETEPCDQVVPAAQLSPTVCCMKKESLVPFVGFSNLGNTCYLNSILQVLCYCPGFKIGVKQLSDIISKKKGKEDEHSAENKESTKEDLPASYEVICNLSSLIHSTEHLQVSYLLNPENYDTELAAQPRRLLNTLRELNPMYEGYLQHDAQEVLQCILGNIQEACQSLKKEIKSVHVSEPVTPQAEDKEPNGCEAATETVDLSEETEGAKSDSGKRKSDNEVGNVKKKTKLTKEPEPVAQRLTRSKRKPVLEKKDDKAERSKVGADAGSTSHTQHKKSKLGLNWLKSSRQPSILSKFKSLSKLDNLSKSSRAEPQSLHIKSDPEQTNNDEPVKENASCKPEEGRDTKTSQNETSEYELVEKLFQGQLVLRTRCLECECFTERREDFQDISVPVQENDPPRLEESSDISPDPRLEVKTLKWAISQFASVERIVGEDKYFCENCHHYTEAERSLLFDKIPEIVTIHLKCFAANGSEFDCYGGLSKVNTPLLTPLQLSLEEWSTKPSRDIYGLFAVVMHSGVTISSGHYTAYVKLSDLNLQVDQLKFPADHHELMKTEPLTEEEARTSDENCDSEVTFRTGANFPVNGKVAKKNTDTVGLLGGQKSKPDFEQLPTPKTPKAEKVQGILPDDKASTGFSGDVGAEKDQKPQGGLYGDKSALYALQSLREYEGKWLLFDDSEVKVTEERDFLSTISPTTQSTSTPYLLFYKRRVE
ncbi:ubiquitin carboxyl-terminal hydrolase 1 isoform X2 [Hyla sarda]|nr:ubiquitin carboxyl-terminal hydrolase 1 isoform X2 [Hyla sarda]XP_056388869.1 ubiquitin carboxyl-terminal hydrolase 1 isoform X2 [Hyla sarda]XP_056388870.1 ubiquitin carboxyl-terminal hydrolase 1 isoform X2 [Hyla sarda]